MWDLDHKESWEPRNWCFWTVVQEKTLESNLDKEIKPVNPKENKSWISIGRTDAEAETPIIWPPAVKNWFTRKDLVAGKDWGQEEKGTTEYEMVGWHHWLKGHEFEQAPGVRDVQGSLPCCSLWGCKELATIEWLNNNINNEHSKKEIKKTASFTLSNRIKSLRINVINETKWSEVRDSLVAQMVKHLLAVWKTWVWSLSWEDPLEKEMAIHSSEIL